MSERISGLDGLRGLAAVIVVLAHMGAAGYHLIPGTNFDGIGRSGVYLFFVLSSFLLSSQILAWGRSGFLEWERWRSYCEARILRIWPLYLFVLVVCLLTTHIDVLPGLWRWSDYLRGMPVAISIDQFWNHILLRAGEDILWTIPVEFKFYFVLPAVMFVLMVVFRGDLTRSILTVAIAIGCAHAFIDVPPGSLATLSYIGIFLTGTIIALILLRYRSERTSIDTHARRRWEAVAWGCVGLYVVTIPWVYAEVTDTPFDTDRFTFAYFLFATLWGLLILGMLLGTGGMRRLLDTRPMVFLGAISYSLYLWHKAALYFVQRVDHFGLLAGTPTVVKSMLTFALAVAVATFSYLVVERPVQRWRKDRSRIRRQALA